MKAEEKIAGGKMLCVDISVIGGRVASAQISGDFFLHPEEALDLAESSLLGLSAPVDRAEAHKRVLEALGGAQLIGATADDIARLAEAAGR